MIALGVDTANAQCAVAITRGDAQPVRRQQSMSRGHAELLVPMIRDTAGSAGISLREIELFAVTTGPGAFTGMRIGLAAVGGLALAVDRPIVGISSFDASALTVPEDRRKGRLVLASLDSKRGDVFVCLFDGDATPLSAPACVDRAALGDWALLQIGRIGGGLIAAGDAATVAADELNRKGWQVEPVDSPVDPAIVASIAVRRRALAQADPPPPAYLMAPEARCNPPSRPIIP